MFSWKRSDCKTGVSVSKPSPLISRDEAIVRFRTNWLVLATYQGASVWWTDRHVLTQKCVVTDVKPQADKQNINKEDKTAVCVVNHNHYTASKCLLPAISLCFLHVNNKMINPQRRTSSCLGKQKQWADQSHFCLIYGFSFSVTFWTVSIKQCKLLEITR